MRRRYKIVLYDKIGVAYATTLWVKKMDPYSFEHNFCKYCPILIILSLLQREIIHKHKIEFPTSLIVCCCTTLKNATAYTSSQKLLNKSAMHAVISLLLQSRKFWWYLLLTSSMLLHYVILLPAAIRTVSGIRLVFQQDSASAHRATHVQQLNCCVKKRQTFLRPTFGLQTAQISVLWIARSGLSCSIVIYHRQIHSVDELKRRLIDVWSGLKQSIFDEAIDQWRGRHLACVHAKGGHLEYSLWTDNFDFVHICYIQCDLFDYIFNLNHASNVGQYILVHFTR